MLKDMFKDKEILKDKDFQKIVLGGGLFLLGSLLDNSAIKLGLYLVAYIILGYEVIVKALKNIKNGQVFDENFLMSIATLGAFYIGEYPEGVAVMLFYRVGELFEDYAVNKSRKSITELMDIRPEYANIKKGEAVETVDPYDVNLEDIMVIKPGERIPLDGVVIEGNSTLDTSALTGESLPRNVAKGEEILSGCINLSGLIFAKVTKVYEDSTVNRILELVENATSKKSKPEQFITKFARYYTPAVVMIALLLAIVPPVFFAQPFSEWFSRGLIFLVISCPCALVISVPLSFFGGIGGASKEGILVKGSNYLEALANTHTVVFDKTGTLTKGVFKVTSIKPIGEINNSKAGRLNQEELLEYTALVESYSNHPISSSLQKAYGKELDLTRVSEIEEIHGHGISGKVDGKRVYAGNSRLMEIYEVEYIKENLLGTVVHVALEGEYQGYILISDEIREDSIKAISDLNQSGKETVMLTGDSKHSGETVAKSLGISKVFTELLPQDKVSKIETLLSLASKNQTVAFVGDGINDAPVLARADVGIAMGGLGSDAAIEAADVVIMTDEPSKVAIAIKISQKTVRIAKQNIVFALGVKFLVLALGAFGLANMWHAVFADVGVSIIAIINAMRALKVDNK